MQVRDSIRHRSQPVGRICAGNCQHFEVLYDWGRKIAGKGVCDKEACGTAVRVGMRCLWEAAPAALQLTPVAAPAAHL